MIKQTVYIGIGSNLQDPINQVKTAISALAKLQQTTLIKSSSLYSSNSLLAGQPDYINAIVCLHTALSPEKLLDELQHIENSQGRERKQRWGARTVDLDIILYANQQISTPQLIIPHSQMALRSFVLVPLLEIAPDLILPDGQTLSSLLQTCPSLNLKRCH